MAVVVTVLMIMGAVPRFDPRTAQAGAHLRRCVACPAWAFPL